MALPVSLLRVVESLSWYSEESATYLHKPTGEIVTIDHSLLRRVEEGSLEPEDVVEVVDTTNPYSERDDLAHAAGILKTDEYLPFPAAHEIDEWSMMDEFAQSFAAGPWRTALEDAIEGHGAFRRFKDVIQANGLAEAWYRFRDQAYRALACEWLSRNGIGYFDDTTTARPGASFGSES